MRSYAAIIVAVLMASSPVAAAPAEAHVKTLTARQAVKWESPHRYAAGARLSISVRADGRILRRRSGSACKLRFGQKRLTVVVALPCRRRGPIKVAAVSRRGRAVRIVVSYVAGERRAAGDPADAPDDDDPEGDDGDPLDGGDDPGDAPPTDDGDDPHEDR